MGGRGRLRLRTWRREDLEAGVVVVVAVLVGGLAFFYAFYSAGAAQAGCGEIRDSGELRSLLSEHHAVAVMFSSDTCPVCKRMEPYWRRLCASGGGGVEYALVKFSKGTVDVFREYGVTDTPTFIVFLDGRPVAKHVGAFEGSNVTRVMEEWALAAAGGATGDFRLLRASCSSCHTLPDSMDPEAVREWAYSSNDTLARLVRFGIERGVAPSVLYNGTQGLVHVVASMNRSLTPEQAARVASALDLLPAIARARGEATSLQEAGGSGGVEAGAAVGAAATLLAGLIAAFSPCVFPLLLAYLSALAARGDSRLGALAAARAFAAAAAGTMAIGALFLALGDAVARASQVLLPAAALVLLAAGLLGYLDVPTFVNVSVSSRRGLTGFSFLYGILAVQCSFPLVAGALLVVASGGLEEGLPGLAAFTLGIAAPVALAVYAAGDERLSQALNRLAGKKARRYANLLLAVMGAALLVYSMGLI